MIAAALLIAALAPRTFATPVEDVAKAEDDFMAEIVDTDLIFAGHGETLYRYGASALARADAQNFSALLARARRTQQKLVDLKVVGPLAAPMPGYPQGLRGLFSAIFFRSPDLPPTDYEFAMRGATPTEEQLDAISDFEDAVARLQDFEQRPQMAQSIMDNPSLTRTIRREAIQMAVFVGAQERHMETLEDDLHRAVENCGGDAPPSRWNLY